MEGGKVLQCSLAPQFITKLHTSCHHSHCERHFNDTVELKKDPENNKPVSLTSVPDKVMEKIFLEEVISRQGQNKNVVRSSQHGFM